MSLVIDQTFVFRFNDSTEHKRVVELYPPATRMPRLEGGLTVVYAAPFLDSINDEVESHML